MTGLGVLPLSGWPWVAQAAMKRQLAIDIASDWKRINFLTLIEVACHEFIESMKHSNY